MAIETTFSAGIRRLYHYQRLNYDWLEGVLGHNRIRFSDPAAFNDPWDCSPNFDPGVIDDEERRESYIQFLMESDRKHFRNSAERRRRMEEWLRSDPSIVRKLVEKISRGSKGAISGRFRVYCLSTDPASHPMWAHYADRHRGVCLEFGTDNDVFCAALQVQYQSDYRDLDLADETTEGNLLAFLRKPSTYDYENEYRLVAQERNLADPPDTLLTDDGFLTIPPRALKTIILGCEVDEDQCRKILEMVEHIGTGVDLKCAVRTLGRYDISIDAVTRFEAPV